MANVSSDSLSLLHPPLAGPWHLTRNGSRSLCNPIFQQKEPHLCREDREKDPDRYAGLQWRVSYVKGGP